MRERETNRKCAQEKIQKKTTQKHKIPTQLSVSYVVRFMVHIGLYFKVHNTQILFVSNLPVAKLPLLPLTTEYSFILDEKQ